MSDDIRCFMVVDLNSGDACLEYKTEKTDRRNVSSPASHRRWNDTPPRPMRAIPARPR